MLSGEGYRRRFWQGYPHLRRLFEQTDDSIPRGVDLFSLLDDGELRTSIDHGPLGRLADVLAIARLLASHGGDVKDAIRADTPSSEAITDEVGQLLMELEGRIDQFQHAVGRALRREIDATRIVAHDTEDLGRRLLFARRAQHDPPAQ